MHKHIPIDHRKLRMCFLSLVHDNSTKAAVSNPFWLDFWGAACAILLVAALSQCTIWFISLHPFEMCLFPQSWQGIRNANENEEPEQNFDWKRREMLQPPRTQFFPLHGKRLCLNFAFSLHPWVCCLLPMAHGKEAKICAKYVALHGIFWCDLRDVSQP